MATALVIAAGNSPRVCVIAAVAVFAGQLTIGWSNDLVDVERDVLAGRPDKPLATGQLSRQVVTRVLASASVVTVIASSLLGWKAAAAQLTVVASGVTYNLGVKSTIWSAVPYAVAFAALPAVATLALPESMWPAWWATVSGALIGVAAHFANVLPDLGEDRQTGVRGLPHRLGFTLSAVAATALSSLAAVLSFVAAAHPASPVQWVLLVMAAGSLLWALLVLRRNPRSDAVFVATMVIAAVAIAFLVTG